MGIRSGLLQIKYIVLDRSYMDFILIHEVNLCLALVSLKLTSKT